MPILIEACVDSVESSVAAERGGAARVELCDNLLEGGTTPSAGMIEVVRDRLSIPIYVMIRPRGGDFCYSEMEHEVMLRDVALAHRLGVDGIAIGALEVSGAVDARRMSAMIEAARPMSVTFHRAFDVTRDQTDALETLIKIGVDRVLTSGAKRTAFEGIDTIANLVRQAANRITVIAGAGINEENVKRIVAETGVREIHLSAAVLHEGRMQHRNDEITFRKQFPPDEYARWVADSERIRRIGDLLAQSDARG